MAAGRLAIVLAAATAMLIAAGCAIGSLGWEPLRHADAVLWDIRLPRTAGAWLAGALLGLAGAVAQGLFRNPLADPYLLGSSTGAALGVATVLALAGSDPAALWGWALRIGATFAGFLGALGAVVITLVLARGVQQTVRLLLAGVIVGILLGALASLVTYAQPELLRAMQSFLLGSTGTLGWDAVAALAIVLVACVAGALATSRSLDALALGETTAMSLGVDVGFARVVLVGLMALATAAAVAHVGLIAFVGLVAPHIVRALARPTHRWLLPLSALAGGVLLSAADVLARLAIPPRELPVGVLTAVLGGTYLLWLMRRRAG